MPLGLKILERGWLSSNNVVMVGPESTAIVDTGYVTHAAQTVSLVMEALGGRDLNIILNTHLHSDHCGGNAALQAEFTKAKVLIPPGEREFVSNWTVEELSFFQTGQQCERFTFDDLVEPGSVVRLGAELWEAHAAPGHDPHSLVLFEPRSGTLISADALWEAGFGVVFPELRGEASFAEVAATLDLIEQLNPSQVIPGHGRAFANVRDALSAARVRLQFFEDHPDRHAMHSLKVLLKFKLLERQQIPLDALWRWWGATPYVETIQRRFFSSTSIGELGEMVVTQLLQSRKARLENANLCDLS